MNFLVDYLRENLVLSPKPIPMFIEQKIIDRNVSIGLANDCTPMLKFNECYYSLAESSKNSERSFTYKFVDIFTGTEIKLIVSKMLFSTIYEILGPHDNHIASGYYTA